MSLMARRFHCAASARMLTIKKISRVVAYQDTARPSVVESTTLLSVALDELSAYADFMTANIDDDVTSWLLAR